MIGEQFEALKVGNKIRRKDKSCNRERAVWKIVKKYAEGIVVERGFVSRNIKRYKMQRYITAFLAEWHYDVC